jgi:murein DD-endopeptidase MepM/ murein hydrolase activator NlpD
MQLIWVAGPASKVMTLSITARRVVMAMVAVASFLLALGFVSHFVGLRVAIEYVPELAHRMGGVTSQTEQMKMEAHHQARLDALNEQLGTVTDKLKELENIKNEALGRLGVEKLLPINGSPKSNPFWGRGGPLNLLSSWSSDDERLDHRIGQSLKRVQLYDQAMTEMLNLWQQDLVRLEQLPTTLPLAGEFVISSGFGFRPDPITHQRSMHEGIDFVAAVGTPILATAPGVVTRAEYLGAYGNMVDVLHADGFTTRYAHMKSIEVKPGDVLLHQQQVGTLGNTGRSTGPHLHYEVIYNGVAMHPAKALAAWAKL